MSSSDHLAIFCCHAASLTVVAIYRTPREHKLWNFACVMAQFVPSPLTTPPNIHSFSAASLIIPRNIQATVLDKSPFVIQFEQWIDGDNIQTRFFALHPRKAETYLEMERMMVRSGWAWGWVHIKVRCLHENTFFVLKMLERVDSTGERRRRVNGGTWTGNGEDEEGGEKKKEREIISKAGSHGMNSEDNMQFDGEDRGVQKDDEEREVTNGTSCTSLS